MSNIATYSNQLSVFNVQGMDDAMRLANAMSKARLVPDCLRESPGDCLMVIEQAMRWGMSPFAVAQATSTIHGKLCFEGKLVSAAIQSSGVLEGRLNYDFLGEGKDLKVICSGILKGEQNPRTVEVTLDSAKTSNQWWSKMPQQMLTYHAARVWARRHTPEVMLGVYSPDEFDSPQEPSSPQGNKVMEVTERHSQRALQAPQREEERPSQVRPNHTTTEPGRLELEKAEKAFIAAIERQQTLDKLQKLTSGDKYKRFIKDARDQAPEIVGRVTGALNRKLEQLSNTTQPDPIEPGRWPEEEMPA